MRRHLLIVCLATAVVAVPAQTLRSDWNVRDHIPRDQFTVQSHRGAGALSPENSMEAFEIAWKLATVPEADLRTTKDGVIVAFHDNDFKRILPDADATMKRKGVADLSWEELRALDIGSWKGPQFAGQRIPRMTDVYKVLEANPGRRLYVDIKNVDLPQLARESARVHKQLILASTDYALIRRWKELAPTSATLHWMGGSEQQLAARLEKLRETDFEAITQLQIHVRVTASGITPSEQFLLETGKKLRARGILFQTLPWENKDPAVFHRLMDLGVASFATDHPDVTMRAIREYYERKR